MKKQTAINGVLGVMVLLALVVAVMGLYRPALPEPIVRPQGITNFDSLTLSGDLSVTGDATLSGLLYSSFADLTITDGATLTAAYTAYALDSAGAVTITLAAPTVEGQILLLINDDANAVVINDTNLRSSDGNAITLAGAYDTLLLISQDDEWLEVAQTAGS